jgi:hypothetical protein
MWDQETLCDPSYPIKKLLTSCFSDFRAAEQQSRWEMGDGFGSLHRLKTV